MTSETGTLKGMYFQLVESQVLSTQGQADVNLHRLTVVEDGILDVGVQVDS